MAISDLLGFIDNKLHDVFASKPYDPEAARQPVLRGIARTLEQFDATPPSKAQNKWFKIKNSIVEFSPVLSGHPLTINGEATNYIPSEQFSRFLVAMKKAVDAGDFDKEIEAISKGKDGGSASVIVGSKPKRTVSEAARANMRAGAAKREATRKAAKEAAAKA